MLISGADFTAPSWVPGGSALAAPVPPLAPGDAATGSAGPGGAVPETTSAVGTPRSFAKACPAAMSGRGYRAEGGGTRAGLIRPPSVISEVIRAACPPFSTPPGSQSGPRLEPEYSVESTITLVGVVPPSARLTCSARSVRLAAPG